MGFTGTARVGVLIAPGGSRDTRAGARPRTLAALHSFFKR
jgi:hypothetical protein